MLRPNDLVPLDSSLALIPTPSPSANPFLSTFNHILSLLLSIPATWARPLAQAQAVSGGPQGKAPVLAGPAEPCALARGPSSVRPFAPSAGSPAVLLASSLSPPGLCSCRPLSLERSSSVRRARPPPSLKAHITSERPSLTAGSAVTARTFLLKIFSIALPAYCDTVQRFPC